MEGHASSRFGARPVQMPPRRAHSRRPQGKSGKGPLPKRPGRDLYRAATDRRNTTRLPSGRIAGKRTEPAGARPPHSCERPSALAAGSAHPGRYRPCARIRSRFCAGVRIGAQACAGRHPRQTAAAAGNGEYARTDQGAQKAPCANGNTPPATQSIDLFRTASPANGNGIAGPGAFYYSGRIPAADRRRRPDRITGSYTKCKPADPRPVCTGAPARVCPWAVRALLFV